MRTMLLPVLLLVFLAVPSSAQDTADTNARRPANDHDLRRWLENMVWHHRFSTEEIIAATGLTKAEVASAVKRFRIEPDTRPMRRQSDPLLVLPYPGGRHSRIGFLDGAVDPQRETKLSVFTPWDESQYVVLDIPEAIWWKEGPQRELLYLAHTHVPTTWTKQGIELKPTEWEESDDGTLHMQRKLPNGVSFGAKVKATKQSVRMEMWLTNRTSETLTGLRVQNCVMFKGAPDFAAQSNDNKVLSSPYVACHDRSGSKWVITAWEPCDRVWANPPCPCMHSDPKFPDCERGQTVRLRGWLSFYEGDDLQAELKRISALNWQ